MTSFNPYNNIHELDPLIKYILQVRKQRQNNWVVCVSKLLINSECVVLVLVDAGNVIYFQGRNRSYNTDVYF